MNFMLTRMALILKMGLLVPLLLVLSAFAQDIRPVDRTGQVMWNKPGWRLISKNMACKIDRSGQTMWNECINIDSNRGNN